VIIYLDTSALVKQYIQERSSGAVAEIIIAAENSGTAIITHVEMASALSRAVRSDLILQNEARAAWEDFLSDWPFLTRLKLSSQLIERAAALAWDYRLRGYDAVHFACALLWQETLGAAVTLATFDHDLWEAGQKAGMSVWPEGGLKGGLA
jgi:uncharacterized protein